ncbi:bifunctional ADP-dependent NAD(P)H-hydrate dehydratase/NAD(P)H-hydrate epimerase [Caenibacillus caldisaponilyticus]|uniref:bifunctional ADP-dependent NAD(P)H-hydrate dehydratase/NAD(P)H-hydrate epimerase n=1 Tax=Caenibacillus caldisaponilyticus TaxID=1674942 RepID=UPI0009884C2E|nr:bifunctional ADP-dependent NAD(P)H-hydrate dehydratase/NAD(P)H-hydrate epimerase [Caenibacillus caldisaponilyticus]
MQIVSGEEMAAIDRYAIEAIGLKGSLLMENAGRAVSERLFSLLNEEDRIGVIIGKGNNGGDGFVIARYLIDKGYDTEVWLISEEAAIKGDALEHMRIYKNAGGSLRSLPMEGWEAFKNATERWTVLVDALLGTGVKGAPRAPYDEVIRLINRSPAKVVAVDLPSGVPADGGAFEHEAVQADHTFTLQCPKLAQYTFPARHFYGRTEVVDIGIPKAALAAVLGGEKRILWTWRDVERTFPIRARAAHKGDHGKGLIVAGSKNMPGAAALAVRAASRAGAGLLTASVPESVRAIIGAQAPEAMFGDIDWERPSEAERQLSRYDAVAFGPGLGRSEETERRLLTLLGAYHGPLIIDADGLYFLHAHLDRLTKRGAPVILTPHAGEMARLIGGSIDEVENDRFGLSRRFAAEYGVHLVLKGPYTIVTTPERRQFVNATGNPGLAKGGSGDVLTGILLGFVMQHARLHEAVCNAVFLHGAAADRLVERRHAMSAILPSDLIAELANVIPAR